MNYNNKFVELDENNKPITQVLLDDILKKLYVYESIGTPSQCVNAIDDKLNDNMYKTKEDIVKIMNERVRILEIKNGLNYTYEWVGYDEAGKHTGGEGCGIDKIFE